MAIMNRLLALALALGVSASASWTPLIAGEDKKDDAKSDAPKPTKGRGTFTISKETTYFVKPLDKDGYVDYVAALNERLREGVTAENNANVLIWRALGPHPEGATLSAEFFKWFGTDPPPQKGDYF